MLPKSPADVCVLEERALVTLELWERPCCTGAGSPRTRTSPCDSCTSVCRPRCSHTAALRVTTWGAGEVGGRATETISVLAARWTRVPCPGHGHTLATGVWMLWSGDGRSEGRSGGRTWGHRQTQHPELQKGFAKATSSPAVGTSPRPAVPAPCACRPRMFRLGLCLWLPPAHLRPPPNCRPWVCHHLHCPPIPAPPQSPAQMGPGNLQTDQPGLWASPDHLPLCLEL